MFDKFKCKQMCQFNDPSDGCSKPSAVICPMAIAKPDYRDALQAARTELGMRVHILGEAWIIKERSESEDEQLKDCDGYCDWTTREIVVEREITGNLGDMEKYIRKVKRHEIVHAFLCESGLNECAGGAESWAMNETMVDWFARQGQKIWAAWKEAGALDE